jgi:hypothetical protein
MAGGDHAARDIDKRRGKVFIDGSVFIQVVNQILRPTPPRYRAAILRLVEDYAAVFGGRDAQLATLDTFLAGEQPYALLLAPTGRGKTALLIHWLIEVQAGEGWHTIFTPISLRYQTASAEATFGALAAALADFHGESEQFQGYNQTPEQLRALVADYLRRPPLGDRRLLLILDGLDEAIDWQIGRDLFPRTPSLYLRIVASARQLANTSRADWLEQLGWRAVQTVDLDLPNLDRTAVSDVLNRMGNPLDQLATDVDLLAEISRVSQGDPLTIRLLVEALQDGMLTPGRLTNQPPGLESFVRGWIDELEQHSVQRDVVRAFLGLCATALGPLSIADLEALAPEHFQVRAKLNQTAKAVARFIIGDGSETSGYIFSHPRLRELFLEKVLSEGERTDLQQRFVAYGEEWYTQHLHTLTTTSSPTANPRPSTSRHFPAYLRQFWVAHLILARRRDLARSALTDVLPVGDRYDQPWAAARFAAEGSYAGYLADLDRLWTDAEGQGNLALSLRCALIAASIRSLSGNLSPELLVGLVTTGTPQGQWSPAAVLEHVWQMPDAQRQVDSLRALLDAHCGLSLDQALEGARAITDAGLRAEALAALAPHLLPRDQPAVYAQALASARVGADGRRATVLTMLVPHLPPTLLAQALEAAWALADKKERARVLTALAPHLPPTLLAQALEAAWALADEKERARVLMVLAPHLPPALLPQALEAAHAITNKWRRAEALTELAPHLPSHDYLALLSQALASARAITDDWARAAALTTLAPHLPLADQPAVYTLALASAHAITDDWARARALTVLAPHLPLADQPAIYALALASACVIANEPERAAALTALAPHLSLALLSRALTSAQAIADEQERARALTALAPHLPPADQPAIYALALASACVIVNEKERTEALTALAPHLPPALLPQALEAACALADEKERTETLTALAPHLPPALLPQALTSAQAITGEQERAEALTALVPHLPPALLPQALASAHAIPYEERRAEALMALAPHVSPADQLAVYTQTLASAYATTDPGRRAAALTRLALHLAAHMTGAAPAVRTLWQSTLRTPTAHGRPAFLQDLACLTPWLAALATPDELAEIAIAIRDVARCWP